MTLPVHPPFLPMEAEVAESLPEGPQWQYEPKWDGFRCLAFRDGKRVDLQSKAAKPLGRYFPELVGALAALKPPQFVLDGEIVVPVEGRLSFDDLLQRIHPAESRIRRLSHERPAVLLVFDLLVDEHGQSLADQPLLLRRLKLEAFAQRFFPEHGRVRLSPATQHPALARDWFSGEGWNLDGVVAKNRERPYESERSAAMLKIKRQRSADCVVGGFRYATSGRVVGSLLLGLYDDEGKLNHVGFTSGIKATERKELTKTLQKLIKPPGFTGAAPGGPSRWATERSTEWEPLAPRLVVEVQYDHFTGGRFRHGTRLLRWRPDKDPRQCKLSQVERESRAPLLVL
jgi:ATP-dependent DNA ligase